MRPLLGVLAASCVCPISVRVIARIFEEPTEGNLSRDYQDAVWAWCSFGAWAWGNNGIPNGFYFGKGVWGNDGNRNVSMFPFGAGAAERMEFQTVSILGQGCRQRMEFQMFQFGAGNWDES